MLIGTIIGGSVEVLAACDDFVAAVQAIILEVVVSNSCVGDAGDGTGIESDLTFATRAAAAVCVLVGLMADTAVAVDVLDGVDASMLVREIPGPRLVNTWVFEATFRCN